MKIRIDNFWLGVFILLVISLFTTYIIFSKSNRSVKLCNADYIFQEKLSFKTKSDRKHLDRGGENTVATMNDSQKMLYTNGRVISDLTVNFASDLSIIISPAIKNTSKLLSEYDLFIYDQLRPETCGEFIGLELVAGNGKYLTGKDPDYQGVFYNRDRSRITVPEIGIDRKPFPSIVPEVRVSLVDLISRLKPELSSANAINAIAMDGLRFRIRLSLPGYGNGERLVSRWIDVDMLGRENLKSYLESESQY